MKKKYIPPPPSALDLAAKKMNELCQSDCISTVDYFSQLTAIRKEIIDASGICNDSQAIIKTISGLDPKYVPQISNNLTLGTMSTVTLLQFRDRVFALQNGTRA